MADILDSLQHGPMCVRELQEDTGRLRCRIYHWLRELEARGQVVKAGRSRPPTGERGRWRQMWALAPGPSDR